MNSRLIVLFLLASIVVVVCCQENIQDNNNNNNNNNNKNEVDTTPIVKFDYRGQQISVPVYENVSGFTEKRLEFDRRTIRGIISIAHELLENLVKKKKNVVLASGPAVGKIIKVAMKNEAEYRKFNREDRMPFMKSGYNKEMSQLMLAILGLKYTGAKLSDDEIFQRGSILLEAIQEVPVHSPNGLYVDWAQMKIDGVPLDVYSAPIIEWFNRSTGRRICLSGIRTIAGFLEKISPN